VRRLYIEKQRRDHGRKAVAVLPIHYPKALLTAFDLLAVELWGPPGPPRSADAGRVQAYVCALVKNALAFLASGGADSVDAVLFPHTCDSIQGLASLAPDMGGWSKTALRYLYPKGERRASSERYVAREIKALSEQLAEIAGRALDAERLRWAIRLHEEINELKRRLLVGRRQSPLSDIELYALLRRGEFLWPEEHRDELAGAVDALQAERMPGGVPIMVTGYVPEPTSILGALTEAGAYLVADDYAAIGRRVPTSPVSLPDDPIAALTELHFATPPCPTLATPQSARLTHLEHLYDTSGARGLIIHELKFCEPELFDVPAIRKHFAARGTPILYLEGDLEAELGGQSVTRIEAFVEMVAATQETE
jgi:benzoyl-CoA reductase/2-hydroxyglutaryl-CoA dehydratase subunit BcrC/BadD/HgdB